ncbi:glycosyltransferase family 4 protein [Rhodococcus sp. 105337]|uniref:glycosyltransferase family 4 protein n=1 Tax=Rhodococcus sp. 105337 TaxID=2725310 RepID=UPI001469E62C|nr:glycosyltransferase family 4 protein [Rhodococcus sp. 105337]NME77909.1 glycosyltransferase family 4 protein [Rhodococcus sp. 105337]
MKVTFLHGSNDIYGASRVLLDEVSIFLSNAWDVAVVLPMKGPLTEKLTTLGAHVVVDRELQVLRRAQSLKTIGNPRMPAVIRGADLVVVWTLALASYIPLLVLRRQSFYVSVHEIQGGAVGVVLLWLLRAGSFPITACSEAAKAWMSKGGISADRISVTYPIFSPDSVNSLSAKTTGCRPAIAVVGRTNGRKGHLEVVRALRRPALRDMEMTLVLAGGPFPGQEHHLAAIIDEAATDRRITYVGEVDGVQSLEGVVDAVACFPTRPESFGLVPLEAWASGIHTLGHLEGGAAEVLPLVGAMSVLEMPSVEGLAAFIRTALVNRGRWQDLPPRESVLKKFSREVRECVVCDVIASAESATSGRTKAGGG